MDKIKIGDTTIEFNTFINDIKSVQSILSKYNPTINTYVSGAVTQTDLIKIHLEEVEIGYDVYNNDNRKIRFGFLNIDYSNNDKWIEQVSFIDSLNDVELTVGNMLELMFMTSDNIDKKSLNSIKVDNVAVANMSKLAHIVISS